MARRCARTCRSCPRIICWASRRPRHRQRRRFPRRGPASSATRTRSWWLPPPTTSSSPSRYFRRRSGPHLKSSRAQKSALVTFGIVPTDGHTGLGYIHRGEPFGRKPASVLKPAAYRVREFKEKPDKPTADRYVETGRYYWNSGMFVWRADTVLNELAARLPESSRGPDANRRGLGHAATAGSADKDLPDPPKDQYRLRRDGAGFAGSRVKQK